MKMPFFLFFAFAVSTCSLAHAEGCDRPRELLGTGTPYSLWGKCLGFSRVTLNSQIPADSIVYFPWKSNTGHLTISVDRSALTPQFVEDVFNHPRSEILNAHQLAQRGIALSLTPSRMRVTIYPSVVLRLRTDVLGNPGYRTFLGQPEFKVEDVSGDVYVATDIARVESTFPEVFVQYVFPMTESGRRVLPDGQVQLMGTVPSQDVLPPRQAPSLAPD